MDGVIYFVILGIQLFLFVLFFVCLVSITIHVKRIENLIESNQTTPIKKYFVDKDIENVLIKNSVKTLVNKDYSIDVNATKEYSLNSKNEIVADYYCSTIKKSKINELVKEIKEQIDLGQLKSILKYSISAKAINQIRNMYESESNIDSFIKYRIDKVAKNKNIIFIKDKQMLFAVLIFKFYWDFARNLIEILSF